VEENLWLETVGQSGLERLISPFTGFPASAKMSQDEVRAQLRMAMMTKDGPAMQVNSKYPP